MQGGAALKASLDAILSQAGVSKAQRVKIEAQVQGTSQVQQLKNEIAQLHDKEVQAKAHADTAEVRALNAQIAALHDKLITITTHRRGVRSATPGSIPPAVPPRAVGGVPRVPCIGRRGGSGSPATGRGDTVPAMLEPGEAVVPGTSSRNSRRPRRARGPRIRPGGSSSRGADRGGGWGPRADTYDGSTWTSCTQICRRSPVQ